jgi:hypothetical protein
LREVFHQHSTQNGGLEELYPWQVEQTSWSAGTTRVVRLLLLHDNEKEAIMLYTIAVVLIILWLLGLVSSYTMGGFIHLLLVIAIVMILLRVISGRKPL